MARGLADDITLSRRNVYVQCMYMCMYMYMYMYMYMCTRMYMYMYMYMYAHMHMCMSMCHIQEPVAYRNFVEATCRKEKLHLPTGVFPVHLCGRRLPVV